MAKHENGDGSGWSAPGWLLETDLYASELVSLGFITFMVYDGILKFPPYITVVTVVFVLPFFQLFSKNAGSFVLAQSIHFGWGIALVLGVTYFRSPLWVIPALLFAELVTKEGVFDQLVEKNPLVWSGVIDWSFYILGSALTYGILGAL